MTKQIITSVLLSFILLYFYTVANAQQHTIKGILKDGLSDNRIGGAGITLKETAFSALSKSDGTFNIDNVHESKFILNINASGYQSYQMQINVKGDINLGSISLFPTGYENPDELALQKTIRATNIAELFTKRPNFIGGNQVFGIPPDPKRLIGNFYLDPKWNKASLLLYRNNEVMEGYFVRYNISSNTFELRDEDADQVTTMPGLRVQNVVWVDSEHNVPRYFVNGMDFKEDGVPISGFFEVLVDGQMPLVRRTIASIKESNYNEALMVGNRNDKVMKRNTYYYVKDKAVHPLPKNRRKLFKVFGDREEEIEEFAKQNEVNVKDPAGYFVLFTQYNSNYDGFEPLLPKLVESEL